jgi:hypothetical protein
VLVVEKGFGDVSSNFTLLMVQAFGGAKTVLVAWQLGLWGAFILCYVLTNLKIGELPGEQQRHGHNEE